MENRDSELYIESREDVIRVFDIYSNLKQIGAERDRIRLAKNCNNLLVNPVNFRIAQSREECLELSDEVIGRLDCELLIFDII